MCGITGMYAFNEVGRFNLINLSQSTRTLSKRGPDDQGMFLRNRVALGHRRLSVIDPSPGGSQPMTDESGRFTIVFNGEIYNYRSLRNRLADAGCHFRSSSDTEVLLKAFICYGEECLAHINGFFAFAIYDEEEDRLFIARDRIGLKPLFYLWDEDKFIFASELKALLAYGIEKDLDYASLFHYLQLNYIPGPHSIFNKVKKLEPGSYILLKDGKGFMKKYYEIPYAKPTPGGAMDYNEQSRKLIDLLEQSVADRLIADVPLGAFLSGGIDSSVIVALASRLTKGLNTFSIGFKDEPYFDETHYANLVAEKFKTNHQVFSLTNHELYSHLFDILDYIDEPFADSSAIPVFILSKNTRKHVTVALSGDGADELFSGYYKHAALLRSMENGQINNLIRNMYPFWKRLPQSRNNPVANRFRRLARFGEGLRLDLPERYWRWASIASGVDALTLLSDDVLERLDFDEAERRKGLLVENITDSGDFNEILYADMRLVLVNDMLVKVDMMSMANGLEVRAPFTDYRLVEFAFGLPAGFKINRGMSKRILQDAFRNILPEKLYKRQKKGFEVPLLKWFRTELNHLIFDDLLNEEYIQEQKIFNVEQVNSLKKQLLSHSPGDAHAKVWALVVFQWWWKKYFQG